MLTFGGVPNPLLNQFSIESNVEYVRDVLARLSCHADVAAIWYYKALTMHEDKAR